VSFIFYSTVEVVQSAQDKSKTHRRGILKETRTGID